MADVKRVDVEVEGVGAVGEPRQVRLGAPLRQRQRDQVRARRHPADGLVELADLVLERAVGRVHDCRRGERTEGEAEEPGVVVHDVESPCGSLLEAGNRVVELPERLADPLARRHVVDALQLGGGARVAGGEESDVDPGLDEALREQVHDPLDPSVAASAGPGTRPG